MAIQITRRAFAGLALAGIPRSVGILCNVPLAERGAREVLEAARSAGFATIQVNFPWDRAEASFVRDLPGWISAAGLKVDALGSYVNCASPETVIMNTRAIDFDRAIDTAAAFGTTRLTAWTGGYGRDLMASDERNAAPAASDAICRFLEPRLKRIETARLTIALESYITLVCPDAASLRALLDRLPTSIAAVLDPPNLTPLNRFAARDRVLREMMDLLAGRIGIVHLKDFRLRSDRTGYELPGPMQGAMNYSLFASLTRRLPASVPLIAEHLSPAEFGSARERMTPLFTP